MINPDELKYDVITGLIPAVILDQGTGKPLMLGYMNKESLEASLQSRKAVFYSRSREKLWIKGETSGNYLYISSIHADCDADALVVYASPTGPVCHNGTYSCFEGISDGYSDSFLKTLEEIIKKRKAEMPEDSYTTLLFKKGLPRITQKVGEEAVETIIAAMKNDRDEIINETADLMYHLLVMLAATNVGLDEVESKLRKRHAGE